MNARINYLKSDPKALQLLLAVETHIRSSNLDPKLMHLVKMRASQINGCAFCLDMHSKDARAAGESEQRLYALDAWQDTPYYDARERTALEWTEALTTLTNGHASDRLYDKVRAYFNEDEIGALTLSIAMINSWNRLNVAFRTEAGGYRPGMFNGLTT
jgi:AhpD family alkylhydroperoxidase